MKSALPRQAGLFGKGAVTAISTASAELRLQSALEGGDLSLERRPGDLACLRTRMRSGQLLVRQTRPPINLRKTPRSSSDYSRPVRIEFQSAGKFTSSDCDVKFFRAVRKTESSRDWGCALSGLSPSVRTSARVTPRCETLVIPRFYAFMLTKM